MLYGHYFKSYYHDFSFISTNKIKKVITFYIDLWPDQLIKEWNFLKVIFALYINDIIVLAAQIILFEDPKMPKEYLPIID